MLVNPSSSVSVKGNQPLICSKWGAPEAGWSNGTALNAQYQYYFTPLYNCCGVNFGFPNWSLGNSAGGAAVEVVGLNPITVSAYVYGFGYLTFGGQQVVTIYPGATIRNDPAPYNFVAGTHYALRIVVSVATLGQKWPLGLNTQSTSNEGTVSGTDPSTGTVTAVTAHGYCPINAFGVVKDTAPAYQNIALLCDSIGDGNSGGGTGVALDQGFIRRGLDAFNAPWFKMTVGGDQMLKHTGILSLAFTNLVGADIVIVDYGANDIPLWTTLAQAQSAYLLFWATLVNMGYKVVQMTPLPRPLSFTPAQELIREQLATWMRTIPSPLRGIIDTSLAETSTNSGVWKPGWSTDMVHPNSTTGEPGLAPTVNSNLFRK